MSTGPSAAEGAENAAALAQGERWYVVHTLPLCETRAQTQLENQGFRTFLPRRRKTVRHARKLTTVETAFFPRYLFVVLDLAREQPHPVPRGVVETLLAAIDAHGILQLGPQLKVGERIRLSVGPFAEQLAILDRMDDSGRIRVLLGILGRQVPVSTHCANALPAA